MSEWLTTGQMIDRLKSGELAEDQDGDVQVFYETGASEVLLLKYNRNNPDHARPFAIYERNKELRWRIIPQYVTFAEAMAAMAEGKAVWLYLDSADDGMRIDQKCYMRYFHVERQWKELIEGKWTIEQ